MKQILNILRDAHARSGHRLPVLMVLMLVTGMSDGLSMALLYPLLQLIGIGGVSSANAGNLGAAFHRLTSWMGVEPTLPGLSAVLIASFLVQNLLATSQNWLLIDIQKKYVASWQQRLVSDFLESEWSHFASQKFGQLTNLVLIEIPRLGAALFAILQLIVAGSILCIYLTIALFVSWKVTLYLCAGCAILLLLVHPIRLATRRYGSEIGRINAELSATLNEVLGGAKLIKASASEPKAIALMAERIDNLRVNLTWSAYLPTTTRNGFEFAAIVMILGAVVYGLKFGQIDATQLLVIVALVARLLPRLAQYHQFNSTVMLCAPAHAIVLGTHERFAAHREVRDARSAGKAGPPVTVPVSISARNLVMRYGENTVLDDVSFNISPGQVVGFVGPSGAGKSTLIDVIVGLLQPCEGELTIGSRPLREIDLAIWREKIGYVSQDTFLFHDTIANNIRWSVANASMEAVETAARDAGLASFVATLTAGYDTIVGDRGVMLSGGQRQRISLARALIRQPALLMLDEPTSALDAISEQEVMNVINSLRGKITVIIVAHRLSTVRDTDIIYVMDHGRIVERGSWQALTERKTVFHRLLRSQKLGEHI